MESFPHVSVAKSKLVLRTLTNSLHGLEECNLQTDNGYGLQKITDLRSQLSWIRCKLAHLKSWSQNDVNDDEVEEVDIGELQSEVLSSGTKVKICEKAVSLYRDTCLYKSFISVEDHNKSETWRKQANKLLSCASKLRVLHKAILHHTQERNEALKRYIKAKIEFIKAREKYESILSNRRNAIAENEDSEVLANIMLQDRINMKRKRIKIIRHLIQGLVGLAWVFNSKKTQNAEKLLQTVFDMDELPPLH